MNFLAHLYLSGDDPKIMVGNFIGDFVKGKNVGGRFEKDIAFGIELHRSIDEFTDHHDIVRTSKKRIRDKYRHYSGVIVDMYYDHFLANQWSQLHPEPLASFAERSYDIMTQHKSVLPEQVNQLLPYMISGNWLVGYGYVEGIGRALSGMSRRTPFQSKMEEAVTDLREHYELFRNEFLEFIPLLKSHTDGMIAEYRRQ